MQSALSTNSNDERINYAPPITQTSFVESLDINSLPFASKARSTGRKHPPGQLPKLGLLITLIAAVVDVEGSVGWPVAGLKLILLRR